MSDDGTVDMLCGAPGLSRRLIAVNILSMIVDGPQVDKLDASGSTASTGTRIGSLIAPIVQTEMASQISVREA